MGLKMFVEKPGDRLATVTAVKIPAGVDDAKVRNQLMVEFGIEIAGGIGATNGQIWRLGLMGFCSQKQFVLQLLAALDKVLVDQGHSHAPGSGVGAAVRFYTQAEVPAGAAR
jgi:aspartate aminotransferase-like enzyme